MGDRVLFQVVKGEEFSPVIYCHHEGSGAPEICGQLVIRMKGRESDLDYTAARLAQIAMQHDSGNLSFGIWNAPKRLTAADSHGDAGVVLVDVSGPQMRFECHGGYLKITDGGLNVVEPP